MMVVVIISSDSGSVTPSIILSYCSPDNLMLLLNSNQTLKTIDFVGTNS
jgi:hypothetical protein